VSFEVVTWQDPTSLDFLTHVLVKIDGERHRRALNGLDDKDYADMGVAARFWKDADRAYEMGFPKAGLTYQCLAVERLFPHLRERLPA
jgi:hypothetical protein